MASPPNPQSGESQPDQPVQRDQVNQSDPKRPTEPALQTDKVSPALRTRPTGYSNPPVRVVVSVPHFDERARTLLEDNGYEVVPIPTSEGPDRHASPETLARWLAGADAWIVGHAPVTAGLLSKLPRLQVIARRGVGYDRVDVPAVIEAQKVATIAAGGNAETVADQTIGMMLALGRRFREGQESLLGGSMAIPVGTDLYEKTVALVGLGRIGTAVMRRLAAFSARILVVAPRRNPELVERYGAMYVDLDTALSESDYLSLHAPLNSGTRFMLNAETIGQMKPEAFLINTARGGLVEDGDLLAALHAKQLAGAGLDVFVSESDPSYAAVTAGLVELSNVIGQPHSGASTNEALARTNMLAARCVLAALEGDQMPDGCVIGDGRTKLDSGRAAQ